MKKKSKKQELEVLRLYNSGTTVSKICECTKVSQSVVYRWVRHLLNQNREKRKLSRTHPNITKEWHPTKNGALMPNDVTFGCCKKVWWQCSEGHEWQAKIGSRTGAGSTGCPRCSSYARCKNSCLMLINPVLSKEWHPTKNKLTPAMVGFSSNRKVWWKCKKGHEWESRVGDRNNGTGCPCCAGRKVCEDNCLNTVNPELASQWHPTKNVKTVMNGRQWLEIERDGGALDALYAKNSSMRNSVARYLKIFSSNLSSKHAML